MKEKFTVFAAALFMLAACQAEPQITQEIAPAQASEQPQTVEEGVVPPEVTASQENGAPTKSLIEVDGEGVGTIYWTPSDEINVFYGSTSTRYISKNTENATTAVFRTLDVIGTTESATENIWGLYPYNENASCTGSAVTTTLPANQKGVPGTFDDDLYITLAHNTSTALVFWNVCGGIKFSLSRNDITSITFRGNNNEDIAGDISLTFDGETNFPVATVLNGAKEITLTPKTGTTFASGENYYLILLPGTLSGGFTMTFTDIDDVLGTFVYTDNAVTIKRSVFSKKADIDTYAEFEQCNKIYYTTSDGQPVYIKSYGKPFDANVVSNTYEDGIGCITFDGDVTSIKERAFPSYGGNPSRLTSIVLPRKISDITGSVFADCTNLSAFSGKYASADGRYLCDGNKFIALASAGITEYTVPSNITSLGDGAFHGCVNLSSVSLPANLKSIGYICFAGCTNLTELTIPDGVTEIGIGAFSSCSKISSVNIPNGIQEIKKETFWGCGFSSIVIPNSVTAIGNYAFYSCDKLTSITIPGSVKNIGIEAFSGCNKLSSVILENGVEILEDSAFNGCQSLVNLSLPTSIISIGAGAFSQCYKLTNVIIPEGIEVLEQTFLNCQLLSSVTLPSTISIIDKNTFWNCTSLSSITLPNQLTYIGDSSFKNCSSLSVIEIPSNVTTIANSAFEGASGLSSITLTRSTPPSLGWKAFDDTNNCPIYVPSESVSTYQKASTYWKGYAERIQAIP